MCSLLKHSWSSCCNTHEDRISRSSSCSHWQIHHKEGLRCSVLGCYRLEYDTEFQYHTSQSKHHINSKCPNLRQWLLVKKTKHEYKLHSRYRYDVHKLNPAVIINLHIHQSQHKFTIKRPLKDITHEVPEMNSSR